MTDQHPITPPPELVEEWIAQVWHEGTPVQVSASDLHLASKAAEWGARWGHQPAPPADGEVAELMEGLRLISDGMSAIGHDSDSWFVARAAKLLQRQALVPVSVSERLPGPSDCAPWPKDSDASAWCWVGTDEDGGWNWEQRSAGCLAMFPDDFTHWLSAHALPIPQQQESDNG